jgi:hypothetical protein
VMSGALDIERLVLRCSVTDQIAADGAAFTNPS